MNLFNRHIDFKQLKNRMVQEQLVKRDIKDKKVLDAMSKVERHLFVPQHIRSQSYDDNPLPIGFGQTISQPYIVAIMTELLNLKGTEKVLEIGTGSGYQTAILAEIAREVYSIEIVKELLETSQKLLIELGYKNIKFKHENGYKGWKEHSPYDGIIVTCAPPDVPDSLIEQLTEGGKLVIPVGTFMQELKVLTKCRGKIKTEHALFVRFVPMVK